MKMPGARMVLECLKREGVDIIFGLPGGAVLPIYDVLYDFEGLRHILVRQEAAAGHAAEGYARTTGKVGVCLVTSGPAATNLVTALQDALMDSIPIVAFTGQVPDAPHRQRRLPGSRQRRHHAAVHEAQLPGEGRQGPRARSSARRSTSRRPAGPGPCTSTCRRTSSSRRRSSSGRSACYLRSYNPNYDGHPGQIKRAARLDRARASGPCSTWAAASSRPTPTPSCASWPS